MKIAYLLHNKCIDGSCISWMNLVQSLSQKGCKIVVICPPELENNPIFTNFIKKYSINAWYAFIYLGLLCKQKTRSSWKWYIKYIGALRHKLKSLIQIIKILKKERPAIIHTNVGIIHEGFWAARIMHIPHVWHLREYQDIDWGYYIYPTKRLFCKLLQHSHVVAISNSVKLYFKLNDQPKAHTIYNGVCNNKSVLDIKKNKEAYFLSACTIAENKGIKDIILAFAKFYKSHAEYKLYIVGDDNNYYAQQLKQLVNDLSLPSHIIFMGYKLKNEVYEYMQSAKALIVASYHEAFGRMTAEAAFNRTIAIGRNTGGTKEILDAIGGVSFDGDYHNLAEKMNSVHNLSEEEYNIIAETAQKIACEKYSIENNTKQILNLYNNLI